MRPFPPMSWAGVPHFFIWIIPHCLSAGQNVTAPKPMGYRKHYGKGLSAGQNVTAPKRWWSTGNQSTVVNHEMGHYMHHQLDNINKQTACDHFLDLILEEQRNKAIGEKAINWAKWAKGEDIDPSIVKRAAENGLSGYALSNTNEMVAEAFAQLYDGSLSDTSKKVLKTLLEHAANINSSENALIKRRLEKACL